jgi:hypothetical protein
VAVLDEGQRKIAAPGTVGWATEALGGGESMTETLAAVVKAPAAALGAGGRPTEALALSDGDITSIGLFCIPKDEVVSSRYRRRESTAESTWYRRREGTAESSRYRRREGVAVACEN